MENPFYKILKGVEKPFRYIGGEAGSRSKNWDNAGVRICLVFPDTYEIGSSHLGLPILYNIINDMPDALAERAFCPWTDMEDKLKKEEIPLFSLESKRPISDFDIVGFSLAYELTYTNVITCLKLANIPIFAKDRNDSHPIIIAGGPCTYNPMPVAPFFDAIAIGDGEDLIVDVVNVLRPRHISRNDKLQILSKIPGIYVPSIDQENVGRARVSDINFSPFPKKTIVPYVSVQARLAVEVARGCTRGCRFCQAGYIYRPLRQREGELAFDIARESLSHGGQEEFSFLSLSLSDWAPLANTLEKVQSEFRSMPVTASLPSLRAEALTNEIVCQLGNARAGSFTLAPEAATERMRRFINKGNTDEDLFRSVEKVFANGWHAVKLYFMIGLPGETQDEIDGIVYIANKCLDIGKKYHKRPDVTVSTSIFIPKAHTPFQWDECISVERALEVQNYFKKKLRRPGLFYRWHSAKMSFIESVFARGGAELAPVVARAHELGARFDSWDDKFNFDIWKNAFQENGIDPNAYLAKKDFEFEFPWDRLCVGPSKEFLISERKRSELFQFTPDCAHGECSKCGMCDFREIKNVMAKNVPLLCPPKDDPPLSDKGGVFHYRIQYKKIGYASFLGGVEMADLLRAVLRASGLALKYSEGFRPRPKTSFGPALPLGFESEVEFLDVWLTRELDIEEIKSRINEHLPEGVTVSVIKSLPETAPSIEECVDAYVYEVDLAGVAADISVGIQAFESAESIHFTRLRKDKKTDIDLKEFVTNISQVSESVVKILIKKDPLSPRPREVVGVVFKVDDEKLEGLRIKKTEVVWRKDWQMNS